MAETQGKFMADFQTGLISEEVFWERVCGELKVPKPAGRSLWADGFRAAYVPRQDMFSMAERLQQAGLGTAILSNTEAPAVRYFHQLHYSMFDVLVFSCAEGMMKPDRKIYELTLEKLGSEPTQSVFIDDDLEYVSAAKNAGLNTILFEGAEQVKNELARLGVTID